jgi:hypothetical protein
MTMHELKSVRPVLGKPYWLKLVWHGRAGRVDLSGVVFRYKVFSPLRSDPTAFRTVKMIDRGLAVAWNSEMDRPRLTQKGKAAA